MMRITDKMAEAEKVKTFKNCCYAPYKPCNHEASARVYGLSVSPVRRGLTGYKPVREQQ
jgi:hypothetical protein